MNIRSILRYVFFIFAGFLLLSGCSKSDDQRKFENESLQAPNDYTVTPSEGEISDRDHDDWRISPMYQSRINIGIGISSFTPPYPNPLNFNQDLTISINLNGIDNINRIEVYTFKNNPTNTERFVTAINEIPSVGLEQIILKGNEISDNLGGSESDGLYRIRILDGNYNVITYGDVKIGTN